MHAMKLGLGTRRVASQLLGGHVAPEWQRAAEAGEPGDGTLLWPVRDGWFVRGYGSGEGGYHLAVDIMGERGSDVLAAAPGIVGYSGHALRGYGNLVMLVHPGGWVTMYAHNERNHVVAGQRVKRGQPIADLGNTGISRGPHVHFEFIHAGQNCDPLALFRPGVRHRPGHLSAIEPLTWRSDEAPPRGVRCAPRRKHPRSRWDDHGEHASAGSGRSRDGDGGEDGGHGALASAR
jgi:murein DD-endopeptidase MepM/ murein hydrolase activator NlpD